MKWLNRSTVPAADASRPRKGFALFMALGALVIIGVLVAGSSFISVQEVRLGQNALVQTRAFSAAEFGLNKIQADWDKTPNLQMTNGSKFDTAYSVTGLDSVQVRYIRLNNETFWIVSEGRATVGNAVLGSSRTAVKRVGAILRLRIPTIRANGAFTTAGDVKTAGSPLINGTNTVPPSWSGCAGSGSPDTLSKAGIVAPADATIEIGNTKNVVGNPDAVVRDEVAANPDTYVKFGDETWSALVAQAREITGGNHGSDIYPKALDGYCDKPDVTNWGEPLRGAGTVFECVSYFPIIYSPTSLHLNGNGRGQGILLINGDFTVNGTFDFYGLVIASGRVSAGNGSAKVYGAVMSASANLTSDFGGTVDVLYSQCGIERAMRGSAQVVQARERAWTELY
jgi:hypothetical protein